MEKWVDSPNLNCFDWWISGCHQRRPLLHQSLSTLRGAVAQTSFVRELDACAVQVAVSGGVLGRDVGKTN